MTPNAIVIMIDSYSEPCQTSKIELFVKTVKQLLAVNHFRKKFHMPQDDTKFWR